MDEFFQGLVFYSLASITIFGALAVIFMKNIVHAAVLLIASFLAIAGIYFMLNADFVGIAQIMIYSVGITLVMLFAIMLTHREANIRLVHHFTPKNLAAGLSIFILGSFLVFGSIMATSAQKSPAGFALQAIPENIKATIAKEGTTGIIGEQLFTKFILPFELLSVLLLIAMIGAVILAKKKETGDLSNPTTASFDEELKATQSEMCKRSVVE